MKKEIEIKEAIPEDAEDVTNVLHKTWLDTYPNKELGITRESIEKSYKGALTKEKIKDFQEKIKNTPENQKRIVAKYGDLVVGVVTMVRNEENNQLRTIYVLPGFQGKGVGKMLWNEVKKFSDSTKDTVVQVATYNKNAIEFYKKLGFVDNGKRFSGENWRIKNDITIPEMEMEIKVK